jgi:hypothetical protein
MFAAAGLAGGCIDAYEELGRPDGWPPARGGQGYPEADEYWRRRDEYWAWRATFKGEPNLD